MELRGVRIIIYCRMIDDNIIINIYAVRIIAYEKNGIIYKRI